MHLCGFSHTALYNLSAPDGLSCWGSSRRRYEVASSDEFGDAAGEEGDPMMHPPPSTSRRASPLTHDQPGCSLSTDHQYGRRVEVTEHQGGRRMSRRPPTHAQSDGV